MVLESLLLGSVLDLEPDSQRGRVPTVLDPAAILSYDTIEAASDELTVATWTSNLSRYGSVSRDGGRHWGPVFGLPNPGRCRVAVDEARIYQLSEVLVVPTYPYQYDLFLAWSDDLGASWQSLLLAQDVNSGASTSATSRILAQGPLLSVFYLTNSGSPQSLIALSSSTGPAGLSAASPVTLQNPGEDADPYLYSAALSGSEALVLFSDTTGGFLSQENSLWLTRKDLSSGAAWLPPALVNPAGQIGSPRISATSSGAICAWNASVPYGAPSQLHARRYDPASGTFGTDHLLGNLAGPIALDTESEQILMAWNEPVGGPMTEPRVAVSLDGGNSFGVATLSDTPSTRPPADLRVFIADGRMIYCAKEDDLPPDPATAVPAYRMSLDSGGSWSPPQSLLPASGPGFGWFHSFDGASWSATGSCLSAIWYSAPVGAGSGQVLVSGMCFPQVDATYDGATTMSFRMSGVPTERAGDWARWAVSAWLGCQSHPENPASSVHLGPSQLYTRTTVPPPLLAAPVDAAGKSFVSLLVGPLSGRTLYVQGWSNSGCGACGSLAGEVFELTIP